MNKIPVCILTLILLANYIGPNVLATWAQQPQPYRLGIQENVPGQSNSNSYGAPQMIPIPATSAPAPPKKTPRYNGQAINNSAPESFSVNVTKVALPPAFLGSWQVHGQRTTVEGSTPEYQQGAERAFSITNDQIWNISGNPSSGYALGSNTGVSTGLFVDKVEGNTAFVRYQHPVGNTMAQEAIVMRLAPGAMQFDGLERISIVKQGLPQPRAKVQYSLQGARQR